MPLSLHTRGFHVSLEITWLPQRRSFNESRPNDAEILVDTSMTMSRLELRHLCAVKMLQERQKLHERLVFHFTSGVVRVNAQMRWQGNLARIKNACCVM